MTSVRKCLYCGDPIPGNKRQDAKYCCDSHRKYASAHRGEKSGKTKQNKSTALSGTPNLPAREVSYPKDEIKTPDNNSSVQASHADNKLTLAMMPPLRGYKNDALSSPTNQPVPPPQFNELRPDEIQPRCISYYVNVPNPKYNTLSDQRRKQAAQVERQTKLYKEQVELLIKIQKAENLTTLEYLAIGASGATIGYGMASKENKATGMFLGFISGSAFAKFRDWFTQESFKAEKDAAIRKKEKQVQAILDNLNRFKLELAATESILVNEPMTVSEQRTKIENTDEILQREKEIADYERRKNDATELSKTYNEQLSQYNEGQNSLTASDPLSVNGQPLAQVDSPDVVSSVGFQRIVGPTFSFRGAWHEFIGDPSLDFQMLIHGPSGNGKSHLAVQLAYYFATNHGTVLYNSSEEGFSVTMDKKLETLGARAKGLDIGRFQTFEDFKNKVPRTAYNLIILDSVNDMHMDKYELQEFCRHYCCSAVIGICQQNKAGQIRGGANLEFDTDIIIMVKDGIATIRKNRFSPNKAPLEIFKITPVPPSPEQPKQMETSTTVHNANIIPLNPEQPKPDEHKPVNPSEDQKPNLPGWDFGWDDWESTL